jgi:hypothetical protein
MVRELDQKLIDVVQRHRAPSLPLTSEVAQQLPDMIQLLVHGCLGVAAMPSEVVGVRSQQR